MKDNSPLAKRMKLYEQSYNLRLPDRLPLILRLDGKSFHSFTAYMERPYDTKFIDWMNIIARLLVDDIQGAVFGYVQSDEISILLWPWKKYESRPWFENELLKIVSVSASMAAAYGSINPPTKAHGFPVFDCRPIIMPEYDVVNYFIWRQQDWENNSLQMLAQSHFSHSELLGKKRDDLHEMLHAKGINWTHLPQHLKEGSIIRYAQDHLFTFTAVEPAPRFIENRELIENLMKMEETKVECQ